MTIYDDQNYDNAHRCLSCGVTGGGVENGHCEECSWCCDCGKSPATTWSRDPLCAACLTVREEHDDAAAEWAYECDAEDRYYREGRYAR